MRREKRVSSKPDSCMTRSVMKKYLVRSSLWFRFEGFDSLFREVLLDSHFCITDDLDDFYRRAIEVPREHDLPTRFREVLDEGGTVADDDG